MILKRSSLICYRPHLTLTGAEKFQCRRLLPVINPDGSTKPSQDMIMTAAHRNVFAEVYALLELDRPLLRCPPRTREGGSPGVPRRAMARALPVRDWP